MTARILSGTKLAATIKGELAERVEKIKTSGKTPGLGTILVGEDPASQSYVRGKHQDCADIGINSIKIELPATATQEEVEAAVQQLNEDPECTAYIVQLPLPKGLDSQRVLSLIDPAKDADGLHPTNLGYLVSRVSEEITTPLPCTPRGVVETLVRYDIPLAGKNIVVVGRSVLVGRSLTMLLGRRAVNATVTNCHTGTVDLEEHLKRADIVVAAIGVPGGIEANQINPDTVVIDVGVNRIDDASRERGWRLVGDVTEDVVDVASDYTPVPGGIGPMTRAMLLVNVVETAEREAGISA